jgi:hypothetical protein
MTVCSRGGSRLLHSFSKRFFCNPLCINAPNPRESSIDASPFLEKCVLSSEKEVDGLQGNFSTRLEDVLKQNCIEHVTIKSPTFVKEFQGSERVELRSTCSPPTSRLGTGLREFRAPPLRQP